MKTEITLEDQIKFTDELLNQAVKNPERIKIIKAIQASLKKLIAVEAYQTNEEYILLTVCDHYRIEVQDVFKKTRKEEIRLPRQIAMYFYKKYTKITLDAIGKICGGKDHSTVLASFRAVSDMLDTNYKTVRNDVATLEQILA